MTETAKKRNVLRGGGNYLSHTALCLLLATGFAASLAAADGIVSPSVANVRGAQRTGLHLVDIYYDIESTGGTYSVSVAIEGRSNQVSAVTFTGDVWVVVTGTKESTSKTARKAAERSFAEI